MSLLTVIIVAGIAVVFAALRFFVPSREPKFDWPALYKTAAHFFIGGLGAAIINGIGTYDWIAPLCIGVPLTAVEIAAFLRGRK